MISPRPDRLLIVNPNEDARVTALLAAEARRLLGAGPVIEAVNAASGLVALATPRDVARAGRAVADTIAARPEPGAVLIGAFGDPGLAEARACAPWRRIVGLGEAGLRAAAAGGRGFAVVTLGSAMEVSLRRRVEALGFAAQLRSVIVLTAAIPDFVSGRPAQLARVASAIAEAYDDPDTEAVLLGGAPFAGLAETLRPRGPRALLDGIEAALADLSLTPR